MSQIKQALELPFVIDLGESEPGQFVAFYRDKRDELEDKLTRVGALKFKGVKIGSTETFQQIVNSISSKFLNYIDGNSPRTKLTGTVYTSTEYDPAQKITMHNELSYSAKWPNKLFFSCLTPAAGGGETLLADSREILRIMNKDIVSEVRGRGITYIRNLNDGKGVGQSWQDTYETEDRAQLEEYCRAYSIEYEWKKDGGVRLKQKRKGIIRHRVTGEEVWFNQMDQFHPFQLGEEVYESMLMLYDSPEEFPIYVTFGDGGEISTDMIKEVLDTIDKVTVAPSWERNELLVVDNELSSHGRNPYKGERKVLVSMSE